MMLSEVNLEEVHRLFSSPGHTVGGGPVDDADETLRWLTRRNEAYELNGLAWYGLWDAESRFLGTCGLFASKRTGSEPEIGYEIASGSRRQGFAQEAAIAVTAEGHRSDIGTIWATIRQANEGSLRIVQRAGFAYVRTEPDPNGALHFYRSAAATEV